MKVVIKKSTNPKKKYMAIFRDEKGKKVKTTHFGAASFSHYPIHKNKERKKRYIDRHKKNENWNDKFSAGALSRWILWNKPTLRDSIADYKRRFNLK
jgi:hypothetical protein